MTNHVLVVGGGLVGLCTAWFLRATGAAVTVLEAGEPGGGASRGNAGAICPSFVEPLPAPGMIRQALASMTRSDAALHVRPAYVPKVAGFLRRFTAAATRERFDAGFDALARLAADATDAYDVLAPAGVTGGLRRDGYLVAFALRSSAVESHADVIRAADRGLCDHPGDLLDGDELLELEPLLSSGARAGFMIPGERWVDPSLLVDELAAALSAAGVDLVQRAPAVGVTDTSNGVAVRTAGGDHRADAVVVAAGVWSRELVAPLGLGLPLLPGKGYSFALRPTPLPERVLYLEDARVMLTPMGDRLRVAGTMEFDGTTDRFNPRRIEAIVRAIRPLLRDDVDLDRREEAWVGPRPMTPDGLPFIGPVPGHPRVVVAAGHNMLGLTLAAVTGRAVAALVMDGDPGIDFTPFAPGRFGR